MAACDTVLLPKLPEPALPYPTTILCFLTIMTVASSPSSDVHSRRLRCYWYYISASSLLKTLEYGTPSTVSSLFCVAASTPNLCIAYSVSPHPNPLSTPSLPIAQILLHTAATHRVDSSVYGLSPDAALILHCSTRVIKTVGATLTFMPSCLLYRGCFMVGYAYSKYFMENIVFVQMLSVDDIVAVAWCLQEATSWLKSGKTIWNACHLTCSASGGLWVCCYLSFAHLRVFKMTMLKYHQPVLQTATSAHGCES